MEGKQKPDGSEVLRSRSVVRVVHDDIIGDAFWNAHTDILD